MASTDATAIPIKNQAYRVTFPIYKNDGTLITGAAGLDSEVSKDAGTFADCTNEATEIATSSGMYYLDLTATEMNADTVALIVKTSTTGGLTTPIVLYPAEAGDIVVNVVDWKGSTAPAMTGDAYAAIGALSTHGDSTWATANVSGLSTFDATTDPVIVGTNNDKTGYSLSTTPPTAAAIADAVWDEALSGHTTSGTAGKQLADAASAGDPWVTDLPGSYTSGEAGYIIGNLLASLSANGVTVQAPVLPSGTVIIQQGDDYANADGRALSWTFTGAPSLTGATVVFKVGALSVTGTVTAADTVRFDLTAAQTGGLSPGKFPFEIEAALTSSAHVVTLTRGTLVVTKDVG